MRIAVNVSLFRGRWKSRVGFAVKSTSDQLVADCSGMGFLQLSVADRILGLYSAVI